MQFADSAHILHVFQLAGFSNNQGSQFAAMGAGLAAPFWKGEVSAPVEMGGRIWIQEKLNK